MDVGEILDAVYLIQGIADPNTTVSNPALKLALIYDLACHVMEKTGYQPRSK